MPSSRPLVFAIIALVLLAVPAAAQNYTVVQPDNTLNPVDPIGTTPKPSASGTAESVSNTSGGLTFFLPVLSLPQRGGWNLTLGYYNTSPDWTTRQDSSIYVVNHGQAPAVTNITYNNNILLDANGGPLTLNLPTLQASLESTGEVQVVDGGTIAFDNLIWPTFDTFIWPTPGS